MRVPGGGEASIGLVLSGGVGLGSYQAGAFSALPDDMHRRLDWVAGSSIGAVNAALIAGNPPRLRLQRLRQFWDRLSLRTAGDFLSPSPDLLPTDVLRGLRWMSAGRTRIGGVPGLFRPSFGQLKDGPSLYSLQPLDETLAELVDFDLLNDGPVRLSIATTDLETGELVAFDTAGGDRIGPEHVRASCGFAPDFPPVEIGGRLLGDGGYSANAPVEIMLADDNLRGNDLVCFVLDLFAVDGISPATVDDAASRRRDLMLGSPTARVLAAWQRERAMDRRLAQEGEEGGVARTAVFHLSYRAPPGRTIAEKEFDFSADAIEERWRSGHLDMLHALKRLGSAEAMEDGMVERIRRPDHPV